MTNVDKSWVQDDETYPRKLGACDVCGTENMIKLAFDQRRWMCLQAAKCLAAAAERRKGNLDD